jgi:hypothetical protein
MRLKSLLPWLCVLALLLGLAWMYATSQKKDQELAALREESQQLQQLHAADEEAKTNGVQTAGDELARLRKENEDVLRLRNEVSQLRKEKLQLHIQLQTAQTQVQGAQAQMQTMRVSPAPTGAPGQPIPGAQPGPGGRPGVAPVSPEQANLNACISNLRQIDGAKQQWALERQKAGSALMTQADLLPYFKGNVMPACPAGGVYSLNPVSIPPICNIPGHTIGR